MAGIAHEPLSEARPLVHRRPRDVPPSRPYRVGRVALLAATICLIPVIISYLSMLSQRSDSSVGIRTVEWLTSNGARGIVDKVESIYYSLTAPSTGGPALKRLPDQTSVAAKPVIPQYAPPPVAPLIKPALAHEGVWRPTFANGGSQPPVLVTSFRSDPAYPQMVAGVAWIDHTRTRVRLYPGIQEPAVTLPRGPMEVPPAHRGRLVASFNSGFKLQDSGGGFALAGHTYAPLKNGLATIVGYTDGHTDVVSWTGGPDVGPTVRFARQNLPLIVNHGRPNPNLSDGPQWGATLGNAIRVWRSGLGIDAKGNLIYAAANYQTVGSLAKILIHAGAVRGMELDINSYWVSFISYRFPGAADPANLLAAMNRSRYRYLTPDDRDFFAVYLH
ncbi:MAG TPA: hypothetical protein VG186_04050 [Solirubrobacteraceae bacterium]|jgi:hypothetical protein|nr:hypothetical protein [Solirubrobacteraceae bacterium]